MVLGILISLVAALHMLAVGIASVLPLLIAGFRCIATGRSEAVDKTLRPLATFATVALFAAAVIGLVAGYLRYVGGDSSYTDMLARFPSRVYRDAGIQWFFSLLCLAGWVISWNWGRRHPKAHGLIVLVAATNLLYHFPPLMFLQRMLADRPDLIAESTVTRALALKVILQGELLSRSLHFLAFASTLSCGLLLWAAPSEQEQETSWLRRVTAWGGIIASSAVILSGIAVVMFIPGSEATRLTGHSPVATAAMMTTVALSLGILLSFCHIAFCPTSPASSRARPLQLAVLATLLMTFADRVTL